MPQNSPMLTDGQWAKIEPLLQQLGADKRGGRLWADSRRLRDKTGALQSENQAGQECKVDGGGRWQGSSFWEHLDAGQGRTRGNHARFESIFAVSISNSPFSAVQH
jgi:hypothetical protein